MNVVPLDKFGVFWRYYIHRIISEQIKQQKDEDDFDV